MTEPATPEAAVRAFVAALRAGRYLDAVRYVDAEMVREPHASLPEMVERNRAFAPLGPDIYRQFDPDMPEAVAEYQARRANENGRVDTDALVLREYAGVSTIDELLALDAESLHARWLEAQMPAYRARQYGPPATLVDVDFEVRVLGHVLEDVDEAHVVCRVLVVPRGAEASDARDGLLQVLTTRRDAAGEWRVAPWPDLLGLGMVSVDVQEVGDVDAEDDS